MTRKWQVKSPDGAILDVLFDDQKEADKLAEERLEDARNRLYCEVRQIEFDDQGQFVGVKRCYLIY